MRLSPMIFILLFALAAFADGTKVFVPPGVGLGQVMRSIGKQPKFGDSGWIKEISRANPGAIDSQNRIVKENFELWIPQSVLNQLKNMTPVPLPGGKAVQKKITPKAPIKISTSETNLKPVKKPKTIVPLKHLNQKPSAPVAENSQPIFERIDGPDEDDDSDEPKMIVERFKIQRMDEADDTKVRRPKGYRKLKKKHDTHNLTLGANLAAQTLEISRPGITTLELKPKIGYGIWAHYHLSMGRPGFRASLKYNIMDYEPPTGADFSNEGKGLFQLSLGGQYVLTRYLDGYFDYNRRKQVFGSFPSPTFLLLRAETVTDIKGGFIIDIYGGETWDAQLDLYYGRILGTTQGSLEIKDGTEFSLGLILKKNNGYGVFGNVLLRDQDTSLAQHQYLLFTISVIYDY